MSHLGTCTWHCLTWLVHHHEISVESHKRVQKQSLTAHLVCWIPHSCAKGMWEWNQLLVTHQWCPLCVWAETTLVEEKHDFPPDWSLIETHLSLTWLVTSMSACCKAACLERAVWPVVMQPAASLSGAVKVTCCRTRSTEPWSCSSSCFIIYN